MSVKHESSRLHQSIAHPALAEHVEKEFGEIPGSVLRMRLASTGVLTFF
jgi:hypothetical protein